MSSELQSVFDRATEQLQKTRDPSHDGALALKLILELAAMLARLEPF